MDIKKILDDHTLWRETGGEKGARAYLRGADLRYANLEGANLSKANLYGAYLEGANLSKTNLYGTYFRYAYLYGANLYGAYLTGANLYGAYLVGAKGILQWQSPQGLKRICYSVKHDDCVMHKLSCFWGTTDEAVEAIRKKYGEGSLYEEVLILMAKCLEVE